MNSKYNDLFDKIESLDDLQMLQIIVDDNRIYAMSERRHINLQSPSTITAERLGFINSMQQYLYCMMQQFHLALMMFL